MISGTITGVGRSRRDDTVNRVLDIILKGQATPLGSFYSGMLSRLTSTPPNKIITVLTTHPDSGQKFITCDRTICGSTDVCS